jgi:hypothetical protein
VSLAVITLIAGSHFAGSSRTSASRLEGTRAAVRVSDPPAAARVPKCHSARHAVAHYRALVWHRQDARSGARATRSPVARRRSCHWARFAAETWVARAVSARRALEEWRREFAWWIWLPANWRRLGACETGYGREPGNFRHANGSFVSAFGISRSIYDSDAAYFGAPPWNDSDPPTPREQYDAARGHYARFGDGWSCPGP